MLHLFDLVAEGWLGDVEPLRCLAEAALLRYGNKGCKVTKLKTVVHASTSLLGGGVLFRSGGCI
jgi:hypothetical protein